MKRGIAQLAALAIIVLCVGFAALRSDNVTPLSRALNLEQQIACPVCDGETVAESNASAAREIRVDIERRVAQHQSDDDIMRYYRQKYPDKVLVPPDSGVGLIAWGLPVFGFVLAAAALIFAVRRWRADPRLVATDADSALVERARKA